MPKQIAEIEGQIKQIRRELSKIGPMRPGSVSRQYRDPKNKKRSFYLLSYTYRMKSRSEYVRLENLAAIREETENFKKCKRLIDQWIELSLKLSKLKTKVGAHAERTVSAGNTA